MRRAEKSYVKLAELEAEFRALLEYELQKVANGGYSVFLWRQGHDSLKIFNGRRWQCKEVDRLESLGRDIKGLRTKLGEPVEDSILKYLSEYLERIRLLQGASRDGALHGGDASVARDILKRMEAPGAGPTK